MAARTKRVHPGNGWVADKKRATARSWVQFAAYPGGVNPNPL
jgi:hypothetical protein